MDQLEQSALARLHRLIRQEMNERADVIATGGAVDFNDYRHKVGVIEGLALAERELIDLVEKLETE